MISMRYGKRAEPDTQNGTASTFDPKTLIKYKDVTGTTNSNGNLTLATVGLTVSDYVVLAVITLNNSMNTARVYTPYRGTSDGWGVHVTDANLASQSGSSENVRIYYIERSMID